MTVSGAGRYLSNKSPVRNVSGRGIVIENHSLGSKIIVIHIMIAEKMKKFPYEKLSVIDAVFWMYGGAGDGHIKKAMCNKNNPFCNECPLTAYCTYFPKV